MAPQGDGAGGGDGEEEGGGGGGAEGGVEEEFAEGFWEGGDGDCVRCRGGGCVGVNGVGRWTVWAVWAGCTMHDFFIGFGFWWETGGGGDLHAHIVGDVVLSNTRAAQKSGGAVCG